MLKMEIEWKTTGPLSRPDILRNLEATVEISESLDDVSRRISEIPRLITYKGGSHVAVHERINLRSADESVANIGFTRLAIVTEEEARP